MTDRSVDRKGPSLYFDTNIFAMIAHRGEADRVRGVLDEIDASLTISAIHFVELVRIPTFDRHRREFCALKLMATRFEDYPIAMRRGAEVVTAFFNHRTGWVVPKATYREGMSKELARHRSLWNAISGPRGHFLEAFRFEPSYPEMMKAQLKQRMAVQREFRAALLSRKTTSYLQKPDGRKYAKCIDGSDPEMFWRADNAQIWSQVLVLNNPPEMREFVAPYLIRPTDYLSGDHYPRFWLEDVNPDEVPRNRLESLIGFYQLKRKIESGNALDSAHATHALDVDHFFTADNAFADVLSDASQHYAKFASVHRVVRDAPSFADQLKRIF